MARTRIAPEEAKDGPPAMVAVIKVRWCNYCLVSCSVAGCASNSTFDRDMHKYIRVPTPELERPVRGSNLGGSTRQHSLKLKLEVLSVDGMTLAFSPLHFTARTSKGRQLVSRKWGTLHLKSYIHLEALRHRFQSRQVFLKAALLTFMVSR